MGSGSRDGGVGSVAGFEECVRGGDPARESDREFDCDVDPEVELGLGFPFGFADRRKKL